MSSRRQETFPTEAARSYVSLSDLCRERGLGTPVRPPALGLYLSDGGRQTAARQLPGAAARP